MHRLLLFCFLALTICCPRTEAQVSRRAARYYARALRCRAEHDGAKADLFMRRAIKEDPSFTDAYSTLGSWLFGSHAFRPAADLLLQAEKNCKDGSRVFARATAQCLLYSGNYEEALLRVPPASADSSWRKLRAQALFMREAVQHADTNAVEPVGPPGRINSPDPELFPFLAADGQTLYFTRRVGGQDEDFFFARPDSCGGWFGAHNMGSPPNTSSQEAAQMISADRHYLFFMRCDNRTVNGWDQGGCDLYMAYTADSVWSVPQSFGGTINTPAYEGMPCLSPDNRELFFVSDRPGGYGGLDIWSSRFDHGLWQAPRNLGPGINTAGDETAPCIHADNGTLYFASNGLTGMGGSDLFISRRVDDTTWGAPRNLGAPINTPYDEASISVSTEGNTVYFASDRDGIAGNYDLYQGILPERFRPAPVTFVKGYVQDSATGQRLNYANIYISDSATGREIYQVQSNRGDGSYTIALPLGKTYHLFTDRIAYQSVNEDLRCYEAHIQEPEIHIIGLLPYGYEKPVTDSLVLTLYFQKNSVSLNDTERGLLAQVLQPLMDKANVTILVNGYTDNSGTPMINEQLSYTRSNEVGAAIRAMGFREEMVQTQGWGEARPVAENDTEPHRDMNRRVEVVIRK